MNEQQRIGALEAMLFAHGEPVALDRLADAMHAEPIQVQVLLEKLQRQYDERNSGLVVLNFEDRWQMVDPPLLRRDSSSAFWTPAATPPSPRPPLEVLAVIAYNQPVSRSFIEQVRGVDSSSTVAKLLERGADRGGRAAGPAGQAGGLPRHRHLPAGVRPGQPGRSAAPARGYAPGMPPPLRRTQTANSWRCGHERAVSDFAHTGHCAAGPAGAGGQCSDAARRAENPVAARRRAGDLADRRTGAAVAFSRPARRRRRAPPPQGTQPARERALPHLPQLPRPPKRSRSVRPGQRRLPAPGIRPSAPPLPGLQTPARRAPPAQPPPARRTRSTGCTRS